MCGIIGYIGKKNAIPILINGLRRMEYRGYDSFGFSITNGEGVFTFKKVGKISDFDSSLLEIKGKGQTGIAHTRWGTHGEITEKNAHPHWGNKKNIFVVHNGIIENYQQLKEELEKEGCKFISKTDTEVLAHLIEKYFTGHIQAREVLEFEYANQWKQQFQRRILAGRIFQRVFRKDSLSEVTLSGLTLVPKLLPFLIRQTHGKPIVAE